MFSGPLIHRDIESNFTIKGLEFSDELKDQNSDQFKTLKKELEVRLYSAFCNDIPSYAHCRVKIKKFNNKFGNNTTRKKMRGILEIVQDFLCKLGIKPHLHLVEKIIISINHIIVRFTKIMNSLVKHLKSHFYVLKIG